MMRLFRSQTRIAAAVLLVAAALVPVVSSDVYWYNVIATGLVFGVLAMSLDLQWGYSGIINLAPAMSFGLGAYSWGIVGDRIEGIGGTYVALLAAAAVPALLGAVVAFVSFKAGTREIYFALITLALTLVLEQVALAATGLTGGSNGLLGIAWPEIGIPGAFEIVFDTPESYYYLVVVLTAIAFVVCTALVSGRFGSILAAIRESEHRAETLGYSTLRYRVAISTIAAALAGVAGMAYAPLTGIVDPSVFGVALSVQVFVWVAVGGAGTLLGPLVAALLITAGQSSLTGSSATAYLLVIGVVFILIVLFLPGGLASVGERLRSLRRGRLTALTPAPPAAPTPQEAQGEGQP
jgi:urea transport system permease protein